MFTVLRWGRRIVSGVTGLKIGKTLKSIPAWAWVGIVVFVALWIILGMLGSLKDAAVNQLDKNRILSEKVSVLAYKNKNLELVAKNLKKEKRELEERIEDLQILVFETAIEVHEPDGTMTRTVTTSSYTDSKTRVVAKESELEQPDVPPWVLDEKANESVLPPPAKPKSCFKTGFWAGVVGLVVGLVGGVAL